MLVITIFSVVALTATALANGDTIVAAITTIKSDVTQLGNTVSRWDGKIRPDFFRDLDVQSNTLINDIKIGSKTASQSKPLGDQEAISIDTTTSDLATQVNKTLEAIIADKFMLYNIVSGPTSLGAIVLNYMQTQKTDMAKFSSEVVKKVPAARREGTKGVFQSIDDSLNNAILRFKR